MLAFTVLLDGIQHCFMGSAYSNLLCCFLDLYFSASPFVCSVVLKQLFQILLDNCHISAKQESESDDCSVPSDCDSVVLSLHTVISSLQIVLLPYVMHWSFLMKCKHRKRKALCLEQVSCGAARAFWSHLLSCVSCLCLFQMLSLGSYFSFPIFTPSGGCCGIREGGGNQIFSLPGRLNYGKIISLEDRPC